MNKWNDYYYVKSELQNNGLILQHVSESLRNNEDLVLIAVQQNGLSLQYASNELQNNKHIALIAIRQNWRAIEYVNSTLILNNKDHIDFIKANDKFKNYKESLFEELREDGLYLKQIKTELSNNQEIVLTAIKQNGLALQYASEELQNNKDIIITAVKNDWQAIQFASNEIRNDYNFMLDIIRYNNSIIEFASNELKTNKTFILDLLKQGQNILDFIPSNLKTYFINIKQNFGSYYGNKDKNIILSLLQNNKNLFINSTKIISYLDQDFLNDKDIMLAAILQNGDNLKYASINLQHDYEIILTAVQQNGLALQYASEELQNNKDIIITAVKNHWQAIQFASNEIRNDYSFMLDIIRYNNSIIEFASNALKTNKTFILDLLKQGQNILDFIPSNLKTYFINIKQNFGSYDGNKDKNIILSLLQNNKNLFINSTKIINYLDQDFLNDKEIMLAAILQNGDNLKYASINLQHDYEIILTAVQQNGLALQYASKELQNNKDIIFTAIKQNKQAFNLIDSEFKNNTNFIRTAIQVNNKVLHHLDNKWLTNNKFMLWLLSHDYKLILDMPVELQTNIDFIAEVYRQNPDFINYIQQSNNIKTQDLNKIIYDNYIKKNKLKTPTHSLVENNMQQLNNAFEKLKNEMQTNYTHVEDYYMDKFTNIISQDDFNKLKTEFIHDWYNKNFPDKIENDNEYKKIQIDDQQALVIGTIHKNMKVTARAGSGKTATLVIRAMFLHHHCGIEWNKILIMAFNRNAADEINARLNKYNAIINKTEQTSATSIEVGSTFHAFALSIIRSLPHTLELTTDDEGSNRKSKEIIQTVFTNKIKDDPKQLSKAINIILEHGINNTDECSNTGGTIKKNIPQKNLRALNGKYYNTENDKTIANWLTCCGIDFRYDNLSKTNSGGTKPVSFILPPKGLLKTTFAIDLNHNKNELSNWFNGIYEFIDVDITVINKIMLNLIALNKCEECDNSTNKCKKDKCGNCTLHCTCMDKKEVMFNLLAKEEIRKKIRDGSLDDFEKVIQGFINRCRSLKITPEALEQLIAEFEFTPDYTKDFAEIAYLVYTCYLEELKKDKLCDFTLVIELACAELHKGNCIYSNGKKNVQDLKYIFIDEYQDFSVLFNDLVQGIRSNNKEVLTFCVGDDWQAINEFAGSDLKFFNNFSEYFEAPLEINMVTNYRSDKNIVELGNSIMSGLGEPGKAYSTNNGNVYLIDRNQLDPLNSKEKLYFENDEISPYLTRILKTIISKKQNVTILSRNNVPSVGYLKIKDKDKNIKTLQKTLKDTLKQISFGQDMPAESEFNKLPTKGSTVHSFKGQQKQAIILLAPEAFPSIHPDWIFYKVLGETVANMIAAEKRLFYVAVTRAQHDLYLIGIPEKMEETAFIEKNEWVNLNILSTLNKNEYPPVNSFITDSLHITIKTPKDMSYSTYAELREDIFKNKGFKFNDDLKIWSRDFSITQITSDDKKTSLSSYLKYLQEQCNPYSKLNINEFIINIDYNGTDLFNHTKLNQINDYPLYYFMNILANESIERLEYNINTLGIAEFLNIKNHHGENILFYLVNYELEKFESVLETLSELPNIEKILCHTNKNGNNIFDKAVLIGNYKVVEFLLLTYKNIQNLIKTDKTYITNSANICKLLTEHNIPNKNENIILNYFKENNTQHKRELLYHFLNYKLPVNDLITFINNTYINENDKYFRIKHVLNVSPQDELSQLQEQKNMDFDMNVFISSYKTNIDATQIKQEIIEREIKELIHFTNLDNLENIFTYKGIHSITTLNEQNISYKNNDNYRYDGLKEYICCSISRVNSYYFKKCIERDKFDDFCIIKIKPNIIYKDKTLYSLTNVAREKNNQELRYTGDKLIDFQGLFKDSINTQGRYIKRLLNTPDNHTTDEQSEVLVHESIHISQIYEIVFKDERCQNKYKKQLEKFSWIISKIDKDAFYATSLINKEELLSTTEDTFNYNSDDYDMPF